MKKISNRSLFAPLVVVLVLVVLFGAYYLRLRNRTAQLNDSNLRRLATMSRQVESTIRGYTEVLQSIYDNPPEVQFDVDGFLWNQTSLEKVATPHNPDPAGLHIGSDAEWIYFDYHPKGGAPPAHTLSIEPRSIPAGIPKFDRTGPIFAKANIRETVGYFVPSDPVADPFDLIALADESGQLIYQSNLQQLHLGSLKRLFTARAETDKNTRKETVTRDPGKKQVTSSVTVESEKASAPELQQGPPAGAAKILSGTDDYAETLAATTSREVEIGEVKYRVYSQPVVLQLPNADPLHWALFGFVRPDRFNAQIWSLPYSVLIGLLFLMALGLLSLPALKLALLSRHKRLKRWDVALLGISMFLGPALLTVLAAYTHQHIKSTESEDGQLRTLAQKIDEHVSSELEQIVTQLDAYVKQLKAPGFIAKADEPMILASAADRQRYGAAATAVNPFLPQGENPYDNFYLVFWTDDDGQEQLKWTAADHVTPFISLRDNPVYREFFDARPTLMNIGGTERELTLAPDRSPTTGENVAVIGIRVSPSIQIAATPAKGKKKERPGTKLTSAFMVGRPQSLFSPVLPPGFEFCIIDESGQVKFHSDPLLNQNENFFIETEDDKAVQSVVLGLAKGDTAGADRNRGFVSASYKGRERRMFITAIRATRHYPELSLVVYRDEIYKQTANAEIATITVSLFGCYFGGLLLLGALWWLIRRPNLRMRLWPCEERKREYAALFWILAFAGLTFYILFWSVRFDTLLYLGILLPAGMFGLSIHLLLRSPGTGQAWPGFGLSGTSLKGLVALLGAAFLIDVSVLPAAAFFRVSHIYESKLLEHYGQQRIVAALERRYDELHYKELWRHTDPAIVARRYRIDDTSLFSYHGAFFESKVKHLTAKCPDTVEKYAGDLDWMLETLNPRYNRIAMEARGMKDASADRKWAWMGDQDDSSVVLHRHDFQNQPDSTLQISSKVPSLIEAKDWGAVGILALLGCGLLLCVLLWLMLRWILSRVFLLDFTVREFGAVARIPATISRNTLLLMSPWEKRDPLLNLQCNVVIDFSQLLTRSEDELKQILALPALDGLVGIRGFDHDISNSETHRARLRFLEWLLSCPTARIVIPTRTEPMLCSLGEHLGESEVERWRTAIGAFRNLPVATPSPWTHWSELSVDARIHPDLSDKQADRIREAFKIECGRNRKLQAIGEILARRLEPITAAEEIVLEAGELAAPLYARIWASCSNAERLVLYYISRDGFLNAKASTEIRELCRKGLLLRKDYQLVNESFRRYVLEVRDPKLVDRMQARGESQWEAFPIILQALVYGLGAIVVVTLAVSQKETLQSFAGYLTAIVGALGTAGKLLSARGGTDRTTNA